MAGAWILEQPRSSRLIWHPRVRHVFRMMPKVLYLKGQHFFGFIFVRLMKTHIRVQGDCIINHLGFGSKCSLLHPKRPWKVFEAYWWMAMYGGLTPKRHIAYSNSRTVANFNLGTLVKRAREALSKHAYKSSKTYKSKSSGKKSFAGSRFLKQTQRPGFNLDNGFLFGPLFKNCLRMFNLLILLGQFL